MAQRLGLRADVLSVLFDVLAIAVCITTISVRV